MAKQSHVRKGNSIFKADRNLLENMIITVQSSDLDIRELLVCTTNPPPGARNVWITTKITKASISIKRVEQLR